MAHNNDNRRQRERRHRRAYMKARRRLDAFDRQSKSGKRDAETRFGIWLKGWRARHPDDLRTAEQLDRVYREQNPEPRKK
jgi:hypothetical protein